MVARRRIQSGTLRILQRERREERNGPNLVKSIAEVGRDNRYISAFFYAAYYFISSVVIVNLWSPPQTNQCLGTPQFYSATLVFALSYSLPCQETTRFETEIINLGRGFSLRLIGLWTFDARIILWYRSVLSSVWIITIIITNLLYWLYWLYIRKFIWM